MPRSLALDRIKFHFVRLGAFRGEDVFVLKAAVHHNDSGCISINLSYNDRHRLKTNFFASMFSSMTCDQLITTVVTRSSDCRHEDTILSEMTKDAHCFAEANERLCWVYSVLLRVLLSQRCRRCVGSLITDGILMKSDKNQRNPRVFKASDLCPYYNRRVNASDNTGSFHISVS